MTFTGMSGLAPPTRRISGSDDLGVKLISRPRRSPSPGEQRFGLFGYIYERGVDLYDKILLRMLFL